MTRQPFLPSPISKRSGGPVLQKWLDRPTPVVTLVEVKHPLRFPGGWWIAQGNDTDANGRNALGLAAFSTPDEDALTALKSTLSWEGWHLGRKTKGGLVVDGSNSARLIPSKKPI